MSDCINRQDALNIIEAESWAYIDYLQKDIGGNYDCHISAFTENIRDCINEMPDATPSEPKGPTLNPNFVPFWDKEEKTIPQMLQDVVDVMCDKYCKWPSEWNEEAEGMELSESDICVNCPLNRLV